MKGLIKAQKQNEIIPPPIKNCSGYFHTISQGESLFIIAKRSKVTLKKLIESNPQINDPDIIFEGQIICIPKLDEKASKNFCLLPLIPTPEATMARGVALVRKETNDLLVVVNNLPNPNVLFPNADTYTAFLLDEATGNVARLNLIPQDGQWIGQRVNKSLRQFNFIIIVPNLASGSLLPNEPIVLEGNLEDC